MLVWRVSEAAPLGEWVEARAILADNNVDEGLPEASHGAWSASSFDLLHGADVSDYPDTVPGDLLDELFKPRRDFKNPEGS